MSDTPPDDYEPADDEPKAAKKKAAAKAPPAKSASASSKKADKADDKKPGSKKASKDPGGLDPIDALNANWEDPETKDLITKQLAKEVLSKGSWATVCFLVQDLDRQKKIYRAPKISVRRYKKSGGAYRYQSGFNISSEKQARELTTIIEKWFGKGGVGRKVVDEMGAAADAEDE